MREAQPISEKTRLAIQDHTALATITAAFEQFRAYRLGHYADELRPDAVASAILATLENPELRDELTGSRIRVHLQSPLGRRAHRMGLLVRRTRG